MSNDSIDPTVSGQAYELDDTESTGTGNPGPNLDPAADGGRAIVPESTGTGNPGPNLDPAADGGRGILPESTGTGNPGPNPRDLDDPQATS